MAPRREERRPVQRNGPVDLAKGLSEPRIKNVQRRGEKVRYDVGTWGRLFIVSIRSYIRNDSKSRSALPVELIPDGVPGSVILPYVPVRPVKKFLVTVQLVP